MSYVLSLDLSTNSTGFAIFDRETKKLLRHGHIKPQVPGLHKLAYPMAALLKIKDMSAKIRDLVVEVNPDQIVIEEINRGISRIGQKTLDALHFFVLDYVMMVKPDLVKTLLYVDSNGKKGWRGMLGLKLTDKDKQVNAEVRLKNKGKKASQKAPLIDWKILAARFVNVKYRKKFDVWGTVSDADEVDAIALADAFVNFLDKKRR